MAHTLKCQHYKSQLAKCFPNTDKVESWLHNNCYPNENDSYPLTGNEFKCNLCDKMFLNEKNLKRHCRNSGITESPKQVHHDEDESSVDTTKYIKSNRTITRTKITSMTIKHYCYLSATVPTKSSPKIETQRNSRRSAVAQRFATIKSPNPVPPKRKQRRVRYKTTTSGKSALADADSSSGDEAPMIENRFSRRIAKRQKLRGTSQRN